MSFDLLIWSAIEPNLEKIFSDLDGWEIKKNTIYFQRGSWIINIYPKSEVEEEDIPEVVFPALPGIKYLVEITLEPTHAPQSAYELANKAANLIAKETHGIILDPQESVLSTPRGVKRIIEQKKPDRISVLEFGWWFTESKLLDKKGFKEFYSILETYLPEVLPRRYGTHSPPQYRLAENGRDHFLNFLSKETIHVTWYPSYPVLSVYPGFFGFGPRKQGFRTNHLNIKIDSNVFNQPGWNVALHRFWHETSDFIHPFYGEVRPLRNYMLRSGRLVLDKKTDESPIKNGWWKGIPKKLGLALVLDQRYADLWPNYQKRSEYINGLYYASTEDWGSKKTITRIVGRVPWNIAQSSQIVNPDGYPKKWPFENP